MNEPSTTDVMKIMDKWGKESFFRTRGFSKKYEIVDLQRAPVGLVRLKSQYERRIPQRLYEPYRGSTVDNGGVAPGIWDMPSPKRTGEFVEESAGLFPPFSEEVIDCSCHDGKEDCGDCDGNGSTSCSWCYGTGWVDEQYWDTEWTTDSDGNSRSESVSRTRSTLCTWCSLGSVTCNSCGGSGRQTCTRCDGETKLLVTDYIAVEFAMTDYTHTLDAPAEIPADLIRNAGKTTAWVEKDKSITSVKHSDCRVSNALSEIKREIEKNDSAKGLLVLQQCTLEVCSCNVVTAKKIGRNKQVRLWVFGNDNQVYAPKMPFPLMRASAFLLLPALVASLMYYAIR